MSRKAYKDALANVRLGERSGRNLAGIIGMEEGVTNLGEAKRIRLERIRANPNQPRRDFPEESLQELANSIRDRGVLQPIRVRPVGEHYEIIAGERRYRASQIVGCLDIPAIVVEQEDSQAYLDSLVENIQREDLNPLDRAEALTQLRVTLGLQSWEAVGQFLGISRVHVYRLLNLRELPGDVQEHLRAGQITEKHGRALHLLQKQPDLQARALSEMMEHELSGDQAMELARNLRSEPRLTQPAQMEYKTDMYREVRAAQRAVERLERRIADEALHDRLSASYDAFKGAVDDLMARLNKLDEMLSQSSGGLENRGAVTEPEAMREGPRGS